jgi:hypothetical protein
VVGYRYRDIWKVRHWAGYTPLIGRFPKPVFCRSFPVCQFPAQARDLAVHRLFFGRQFSPGLSGMTFDLGTARIVLASATKRSYWEPTKASASGGIIFWPGMTTSSLDQKGAMPRPSEFDMADRIHH